MARDSAGRVAAGALARQLLSVLGVEIFGFVTRIGQAELPVSQRAEELFSLVEAGVQEEAPETLRKIRDSSPVYSLAEEAEDLRAKAEIDAAKAAGDTLGGLVEVRVVGVPFGLGTHAQWDAKLDGLLAQAVMAVQAIKGVEIGLGFRSAELPGSEVHDIIRYDQWSAESRTCGFERPTNRAGGLEAGMTNTKPIVVRAAMKPIATLKKPLESVNLKTLEPQAASWERSDTCAVPATSVVLENVVAFTIAQAVVEKFGGDSLQEIIARWDLYQILAQDMS
ncbi:MAG: chorismate synthase [Kiritimatiellaeota bacterium]|nr:chorismate synthase [Kiritimatiellota bacterium]